MTSSVEQHSPGSWVFHVLGIQVTVVPWFWGITLLLASSRMEEPARLLVWTAVVFVSVLAHELGHAWVARRLGQSVSIELHGMGGSAYHSGTRPLTAWQQVMVSLAGPLAGALLGLLVFVVARQWPNRPELVGVMVGDALWVNWGYGLVNLLPILPLDGGRVVQSVVDGVLKTRHHPAAAIISLLFAGGLTVLALQMEMRWALVLLVWLGISNGRSVMASLEARKDQALEPAFQKLEAALQAEDGAAVVSGAQHLLQGNPGTASRARALHMLALGHLQQGAHDKALAAMQQLPAGYHKDPWVLGLCHLHQGDISTALTNMAQAWAEDPSPAVADAYTQALLKDNQVDKAMAVVLGATRDQVDPMTMERVAHALYVAERYEASLRVDQASFERHGSALSAFNAACNQARRGLLEESVAWLEKAVQAGWNRRTETETDEDLAPLRGMPRFQELLQRIREPTRSAGEPNV